MALTAASDMIVVHYLNQFFAGLGGEEAAGTEPTRIDGAVGPGRGLEGAGLHIDVTLSCGDNYFGEHEDCRARPVARMADRDRTGRRPLRPGVRVRKVWLRLRFARSRGRPQGYRGGHRNDAGEPRRARR